MNKVLKRQRIEDKKLKVNMFFYKYKLYVRVNLKLTEIKQTFFMNKLNFQNLLATFTTTKKSEGITTVFLQYTILNKINKFYRKLKLLKV